MIPFSFFSSLTSVSEMGETKPTGRGLWGWLDMANVLGHECFAYVLRNRSGLMTLHVVIITFMFDLVF